jgi:hypothetical protein
MLSIQNECAPFEFELNHSIQNGGGALGGSWPLPGAGYVHASVFQPVGVCTVKSGPFTVPPAPPFWIEWFSSNSNGAHSFWIDNIRTVPEPAGLLALPALGALLARRRRT